VPFEFEKLDIPGLVLIRPQAFADERGFFMETYQAACFKEAGIDRAFVQDNHSGSRRGILRGLHYQIRQPQGKLVRVVSGEVWDVAVDLRRNSPAFGKWAGFTLSAESKRMAWIPPGFAHGFVVVSETADVLYKATDYYAPEHERTLLWSDPALGIQWPLAGAPVVADKDRSGTPLRDAELFA